MSVSRMKGTHVLITGGCGFIGSNLARRCRDDGAVVTICDAMIADSGANLHNIADLRGDVEILATDIRDRERMKEAVSAKDVIFHCAAHTSHMQSMTNPFLNTDINCNGTLSLLEAVRQADVRAKVVHVGTSTQVGRMLHSPVDETHVEFPLDMYSANKTAAEKYVHLYGHAYGIRTAVVRLPNVYGPRAYIKGPTLGFMNYFIGLALQGRDIPVYGDGMQKRSVLFVDDAVAALMGAAADEQSNGEVFFAASDHHVSVKEVALAISASIGGKVCTVPWTADRKGVEIGDAVISNSKISRMLGWKPLTDLETGLKKTRDFYSSCLDKYLDLR